MYTLNAILVYFTSIDIPLINKFENAAALLLILEIGVFIIELILICINKFLKFKLITELISKSKDIIEVCTILCISFISIVLLSMV